MQLQANTLASEGDQLINKSNSAASAPVNNKLNPAAPAPTNNKLNSTASLAVNNKSNGTAAIPANNKLNQADQKLFSNKLAKIGIDRIKNNRLFYPQSWTPTLNPYATPATKVIGDWLMELKIIRNQETLQIFQEERADLYGGYSFSCAKFERFTTVTKFLVLWILFDDLAIENSKSYWQENNLSLDDYATALRGGSLSPNADPFLRAWWELGQCLSAKMSQKWLDSFADEFVHWAKQSIKEYDLCTSLRKVGRLPDLDTYFNIRFDSVGALSTMDLIEYAEEFELPDQVKNNQVFRTLRELATNIIFLANDIFSLEKDMIAQWPNSVTVVQQEYGLTLSEALHRTVDIHNEYVFSFIDVEKKLPSFGDEIDPFVHTYIERIKLMCRGFTEFESIAERYQWKHQLAPGKAPFEVSVASFTNS